MIPTPSPGDVPSNRSPGELRLAIADLTPADHARLVKVAHVLAHGLPEEPEDLIQEAIVRTISGTRKCPRRMAIPAFLYGVMRSLASAARKRGDALRFVPFEDDAMGPPATGPGAGNRVRDMRRRLLALFDDGSAERRVIELQLEGLRGAPLRKSMGYSRKQLATVRRRIRRRVERVRRSGLP